MFAHPLNAMGFETSRGCSLRVQPNPVGERSLVVGRSLRTGKSTADPAIWDAPKELPMQPLEPPNDSEYFLGDRTHFFAVRRYDRCSRLLVTPDCRHGLI
jgi:hypothetical protein